MSEWTAEEIAKMAERRRRLVRFGQAQHAPKSTIDTRIALVAFELGLSDRQLEQFYFVNRKGSTKRHFNREAFAKKYGIDIHWIWDGNLCGHPRGLVRKQSRKTTRRAVQPQEGGAA
jgi:hypothetical protein